MRKSILLVIYLSCSFFSSTSKAQSVSAGDLIIDAYYGFPNLYTSAYTPIFAFEGYGSQKVKTGFGPLGIRAEYILFENFGFGLDVGFRNATFITTYEEFLTYDTLGKSIYNTYTEEVYVKKLGVMATLNYHFNMEDEKVDPYVAFGVGYKKQLISESKYYQLDIPIFIPISMKIGFGLRYLFTPKIAGNICVGLGQGGVINGGISAKF